MNVPLRRPRRLRPGSLVGVAALSGPVRPESLDAGVAALEGFGYSVRVARNVLEREPLLGLAGDDDSRASGYLALVEDPEVEAILFARGGYGVTRLLQRLPARLLAETAKLHCGFSDLTALSAFLRERCGLVSIHGPMVAAELAAPLDSWTAPFFPALLEGRGPARLTVPASELLVPGRAEGPLVGGCLSLLAALSGTPWDYDYEGALLFLEEVGEEAYRVDRMLGTLVSSGRWTRLAGIIVGSMTRVTFGGSEDPERLRQLLFDRLAPLGVPVALGLPFGHGGANVPLPVGARASWDGEARTLAFEEEFLS
ncbi:MAG TPA: LD-carboxypeptidase [Thermoanaerobaculia bacterium]|nr:LD-carboxypeptidase [Thermoanaerobaculia bacterium]HPA52771.1 LD-carboxypeptidase [Thermoanaerobaculia bacterium]HQN07006.1 LD-carboxypeptidase [Thermoanaerobaculia bacterium]HQP85155.1 LD-carboxypeptidase [Thermoanaerobaculia bacterium]